MLLIVEIPIDVLYDIDNLEVIPDTWHGICFSLLNFRWMFSRVELPIMFFLVELPIIVLIAVECEFLSGCHLFQQIGQLPL